MPDEIVLELGVEYAGELIPVYVKFANRKRLSITVHPNCSVTALAPAGCSLETVSSHLKRRRSWIAKQRRFFEVYHPLPEPKRFVSGETHLYIGRQYRLKVYRASKSDVKLVGRFFNVFVPQPEEPSRVCAALDTWYRAHAEPIFRERINRCLKSAPSLKAVQHTLRVRRMTKRWGSCSKNGTITLSTELIKTPLHCIDYVILHELCHLRVHNHSPAFFRLLNLYMPDWEERKRRLDAVVL